MGSTAVKDSMVFFLKHCQPATELSNSLLRSDHESRAVEVSRLLPDVETMQVHLLTRGRLNHDGY